MSGRIRVAIAGVGNCASSLVQGVEYYRNADPDDDVPGLMHVVLGGYHVGDVEFVAAFDVDAAKVGLDLGKAIFAGQNNTISSPTSASSASRSSAARRSTVSASTTARRSRSRRPRRSTSCRCCATRRPTCSSATCRWAPRRRSASTRRRASTPASAFVNAIPVFIASDPEWAAKFDGGRRARSSATTSRARSAPPSSTACSPACSRTAA